MANVNEKLTPLGIVNVGLEKYSKCELASAGEVTDMLLDIRNLLIAEAALTAAGVETPEPQYT